MSTTIFHGIKHNGAILKTLSTNITRTQTEPLQLAKLALRQPFCPTLATLNTFPKCIHVTRITCKIYQHFTSYYSISHFSTTTSTGSSPLPTLSMSSEDLAPFPVTSRFFSRFQDDSRSPSLHRQSKAIHVNNSTANYLPFSSPQSRPKQSYPINLFNLPHRISVDEHRRPLPQHKGAEEIPVFQYDHATMSDPILFAELMKETGQRYGAIKIIMPESFNTMARTNFQVNPDLFQFKTNRILANPKENEILTRLRFYNELIGFHILQRAEAPEVAVKTEEEAPVEGPQKEETLQSKEELSDSQPKETKAEEKQKTKLPLFLQKLPMMDKRPLDLFDLFRLVVMRGGYNEVINRKLWAQIGRELGYKGKITSSLSSSLKLSYAKILYPLETFLGQRCAEVAGLADRPGDGEPPAKKLKVDPLAPLLLGSAKEYRRSVKAKASKGILLNQPHLIDVKPPLVFSSNSENGSAQGETKANKNTTSCSLTPAAQINSYLKWISTNAANLQDATRHEPNGKSASIYSLRQFIEKDCKFQEVLISSNPAIFGINSERQMSTPMHNLPNHLTGFQISEESSPISPQALEDIYWQRVCHEGVDDILDGLKIENGFSLPHLANSSGFLRIGDDFTNYKLQLNTSNQQSVSFSGSESTKSQEHISTASSKSGTPTPADTPVSSSRPSFNGDTSTSSSHSEALILNCQPYISRTIGNSLAPFNLHNIPTLPNSLLGALSAHDVNNNDMYNSRLNVGMTFSSENWHSEDHFLQRCSYHFFGRSKRWYFIPELDFLKFEELLREINTKRDSKVNLNSQSESWQIGELLKFLSTEDESLNFEYECLLNSLENMVNPYPEVRAFINDPEFQKIIDFQKSKRDSIYYNQEYFINPEMLHSRGIRFTTTLQKPGEIILQYPKSYSLSISLGLNITEDVNFASKGWLDYALEGEEWLKKQGILPNISLFKLLVNIASLYENNCGSFDSDVYTKALECYDKLLEKELELRNKVRTRVKMKEVVIEERSISDADGIADDNLQNLFPSKILINNTKDGEQFSMSLESFLQYSDALEVQKRENQEQNLPDFISSTSHKIELHLFLSDDRLKNYQRVLSGYSIEFDEWVTTYETVMKDEEEVPFKTYKNLLGDGQKILAALSSAHPRFKRFVSNGSRGAQDLEREEKMKVFKEYVENLDHFVTHCNDIIEECQAVLSLKHQQRIRGASENIVPQEQDKQGKLSTLLDLANKIPKLNFYAVEFDQVLEFKNEIQNFDRACRNLISKPNVQQSELNDMINLGTSFGIKLPILDFLVRLRDREVWIKTFNILFEGGDPFAGKKEVYSLSHLQQFHNDGLRVLSAKDVDHLQQVDAWLKEGNLYDEKVNAYISNHKQLNKINLAELDNLIIDMEERAKEIKEKRLFVFMESYHKLVDIKAQAPLVKFLQKYQTTKPSLFAAKQMMADLEKSKYDYDDSEIKADLDKSLNWLGNLWTALKKVKASFGSRAKRLFDTQTLKQAVNTELVKKLSTIYTKTATNLAGEEVDPFERSGGYLFLKDIDPVYDEKHPLRYCLCREFEDGIMIECDRCHEWYHIFCVKEKLEIEENDDNYVCPACLLLDSDSILAEFAEEKITDSLIDEFVASGEDLKIKPSSELDELKRLKEQIDEFKKTFSGKVWNSEQTALLVHYEAYIFRKVFGAPVLITSIYEKLSEFLKTNLNILLTAKPEEDVSKNVEKSENDMDVDRESPAATPSRGSTQSPKDDANSRESVTRSPTDFNEDQRRFYSHKTQPSGPILPPPVPQFFSPLSMAKQVPQADIEKPIHPEPVSETLVSEKPSEPVKDEAVAVEPESAHNETKSETKEESKPVGSSGPEVTSPLPSNPESNIPEKIELQSPTTDVKPEETINADSQVSVEDAIPPQSAPEPLKIQEDVVDEKPADIEIEKKDSSSALDILNNEPVREPESKDSAETGQKALQDKSPQISSASPEPRVEPLPETVSAPSQPETGAEPMQVDTKDAAPSESSTALAPEQLVEELNENDSKQQDESRQQDESIQQDESSSVSRESEPLPEKPEPLVEPEETKVPESTGLPVIQPREPVSESATTFANEEVKPTPEPVEQAPPHDKAPKEATSAASVEDKQPREAQPLVRPTAPITESSDSQQKPEQVEQPQLSAPDSRNSSSTIPSSTQPPPVAQVEPGDDTFLASLAADFPNTSAYPDETYVDQSLPFISSEPKQEASQDTSTAQSAALGEMLLAELGENPDSTSNEQK